MYHAFQKMWLPCHGSCERMNLAKTAETSRSAFSIVLYDTVQTIVAEAMNTENRREPLRTKIVGWCESLESRVSYQRYLFFCPSFFYLSTLPLKAIVISTKNTVVYLYFFTFFAKLCGVRGNEDRGQRLVSGGCPEYWLLLRFCRHYNYNYY